VQHLSSSTPAVKGKNWVWGLTPLVREGEPEEDAYAISGR